MTRFLAGMFATSLVYLAAYIYGPELLQKLFGRGDGTDWGDCCKRPTLEQMTGRLPNE